MIELSESDRRLLEEVQQDFPLHSRPYEIIGKRCGLSESRTIQKIEEHIAGGIIREISVILNAGKLGYKSTLVAVRTKKENVEAVAAKISSHGRVSHNYLRNHAYNLWFTLAVHRKLDFKAEIEKLLEKEEIINYLILPAVRTFKLRVNLRFSKAGGKHYPKAVQGSGEDVKLSDQELQLLDILQESFAFLPDPWGNIAASLDISEDELFASINHLKKTGVIRRIAAVLRHRKAGFKANGMACFKIPEAGVIEAGRKAAEFAEVSHCYQRLTCPDWEYPLFAMVHARSRPECESIITEISKRIGCEDYITLYSIKEFKKIRIKYF